MHNNYVYNTIVHTTNTEYITIIIAINHSILIIISWCLPYYQLLNLQVLNPEIPMAEQRWVDAAALADYDHCCPHLHW